MHSWGIREVTVAALPHQWSFRNSPWSNSGGKSEFLPLSRERVGLSCLVEREDARPGRNWRNSVGAGSLAPVLPCFFFFFAFHYSLLSRPVATVYAPEQTCSRGHTQWKAERVQRAALRPPSDGQSAQEGVPAACDLVSPSQAPHGDDLWSLVEIEPCRRTQTPWPVTPSPRPRFLRTRLLPHSFPSGWDFHSLVPHSFPSTTLRSAQATHAPSAFHCQLLCHRHSLNHDSIADSAFFFPASRLPIISIALPGLSLAVRLQDVRRHPSQTLFLQHCIFLPAR